MKYRIKLNQLLKEWPRGTIFTTSYLEHLGYSLRLLQKYKASQWIESVGHGAYKLAGDQVGYGGAVYALQNQLNLTIHPGGKTALTLSGFGHYIPSRETHEKVFLYGEPGEKLSGWFTKHFLKEWMTYKSTKLFTNNFFQDKTSYTVYSFQNFNFAFKISSAERAMLEMLYLVPYQETFEECFLIMENLTTLRSHVVQTLLENCTSIKVKRLFLYMAEKLNYSWFGKLSLEKIDLGRGKRVIIKNGTLDTHYNITVPKIKDEEIP